MADGGWTGLPLCYILMGFLGEMFVSIFAHNVNVQLCILHALLQRYAHDADKSTDLLIELIMILSSSGSCDLASTGGYNGE